MTYLLFRTGPLCFAAFTLACSSGGASTANQSGASSAGGSANVNSAATFGGNVSTGLGGGASGATSEGSTTGGAGSIEGTGGAVIARGGSGGAGGADTTGGVVASGGAALGKGGSSATASGGSPNGAGSGGSRVTSTATGFGGTLATSGSTGGAGASSAGSSSKCLRCASYAAPSQTGSVAPSALSSLSGLALSRTQSDVVFAHNDGSRALVYALDSQGREHAQITLTGATATDIEDIAVGPCGTANCVYVGDIGDNNSQRSEYAVLRFVEPTIPASPGQAALTTTFERFRFAYEDGSHNAEGLMVASNGTIYVVTKLAPGTGGRVEATGPSSVYRLPTTLSTDAVMTATKVATLPVPTTSGLAASGAAAHPCGLGFLLRTYDRVYEFTTPAGMPFESAFGTVPKEVATPNENQSEGIDYRADGRGFITSGEGAGAPIFLTGCAE